jgi:FKBP-type peptidyl-prolyl cis-trans isomerase FklB
MKKILVGMLVISFAYTANAQVKKTTVAKPVVAKSMFKNLLDSFSYAAGYNVAKNMKAQGITELNSVLMKKAIDDVYKDEKPILAEPQLNSCLQNQIQVFNNNKELALKKNSTKEIAKGVVFLQANKLRKEVITLPNGIQYEVIKSADSITAKPMVSDNVTVNYVGTLIDGKEFDNSYKRGQPATFRVTGVIRGWTEILQLMHVGDKWRVYIPTELAYNLNPPTPAIPPGAALIFEIALEGITPAHTE